MINLAFKFDDLEIYADDDPAYKAGAKAQPWDALLTPEQRKLALLFMGAIHKAKQYNLPVDVERLIEACRDYFFERRITIA